VTFLPLSFLYQCSPREAQGSVEYDITILLKESDLTALLALPALVERNGGRIVLTPAEFFEANYMFCAGPRDPQLNECVPSRLHHGEPECDESMRRSPDYSQGGSS